MYNDIKHMAQSLLELAVGVSIVAGLAGLIGLAVMHNLGYWV